MKLEQPFYLLSKVFEFTRLKDASSGNVAYTGVGFRPRALLIVGVAADNALISWGFADSSLKSGGVARAILAAPIFDYLTDKVAGFFDSAIADQFATVASLDVDGFTLTWTKSGGPAAGVITLRALCLG